MKVKASIPVRKFVCEPGRVMAEGKTATPSFCYRVKVEARKRQKVVIELHSRVTGRKIGYIGKGPSNPFSPTRAGAGEWTQMDMPAHSSREIPIKVAKKMQFFIKFAQKPDPKALPQFQKTAKLVWTIINREARKK